MTPYEVDAMVRSAMDAHAQDRDAGDALLWQLVAFYESATDDERDALARCLVGYTLRMEPPRFWAALIDVLAHVRAVGVAPLFVQAIETGQHEEAWVRHVTFALLRMRYAPERDRYVGFIEPRILSHSDQIGTMIPALAFVDEEESIRLAARYFETWMGRRPGVENILPSYVSYWAKDAPHLFAKLFGALQSMAPSKAALWKSALTDELKKPWQVNKYGADLLRKVMESLNASPTPR